MESTQGGVIVDSFINAENIAKKSNQNRHFKPIFPKREIWERKKGHTDKVIVYNSNSNEWSIKRHHTAPHASLPESHSKFYVSTFKNVPEIESENFKMVKVDKRFSEYTLN